MRTLSSMDNPYAGLASPAAKRSAPEASSGAAKKAKAASEAPGGGGGPDVSGACGGAAGAPQLRPATVSIEVAVASHAGRRAQMEDAHCLVTSARFASLLASEGVDAPAGMRGEIYGVLDGHNGKRVAELCCERLPVRVAGAFAMLLRQQARSPRGSGQPVDGGGGGGAPKKKEVATHCWHGKKKVEAALKRACAAVEEDALASGFDAEGCCCVAVVIVQDECHVVNLGDSRAVLVRATKGCFDVTSTRVFSDQFSQEKHSWHETLTRDDHPSKNEPKRAETD